MPRSPIAEAYRVLRTNIQFGSVDKPVRSLLVTSVDSMEGKSTTVANLAVVMAQAGKRVVIVDADLRRPTQHKYFELPNDRGLTTALLDGQTPVCDHLQATGLDNLYLLSSGPLPPNPAELLGSQRMGQVIEELAKQADVLVFDSPPLLAVTDAALLARQLDGTLVVVDAGGTRRGSVARAFDALRASGAHVLGAALNRIIPARSGYYHSYYYYHYYYSEDGQRKHKRRILPRWRWPWQRSSRSSGRTKTQRAE